jgi:Reverse transcriptase-like
VRMIGDCEILVKAMKTDSNGVDPELRGIRRLIKETCKDFDKVTFHHVMREFNKRQMPLPQQQENEHARTRSLTPGNARWNRPSPS